MQRDANIGMDIEPKSSLPLRQLVDSLRAPVYLHSISSTSSMAKRSRCEPGDDGISSILSTTKHPKMAIDYLLNTETHTTVSSQPHNSSCSDMPHRIKGSSMQREHPSVRDVQRTIEETSSEVSAEQLPPHPHKCHECGKVFKEQGNLTKHRRSVHAPRPLMFQCNVGTCSKRFSFRDGLNRHQSTVHDGIRAHTCPVAGCAKRFKQRSHSAKHVRTVHKGHVADARVNGYPFPSSPQ
jgi:hypothetical protein